MLLGWYDESSPPSTGSRSAGDRSSGANGDGRTGPARGRDDRERRRRATWGDLHADGRRGRVQRRGHDVRWHRDQRGHDHQPLLAPADDPGQWTAVTGDPSLAANAVEESLRLEPAAGRVDRYATADVELGGAEVRTGDLVIVSLTAANRDPATFPDPDAFDVSRPNARSHLAFAQGPHACIGLHLARLETGRRSTAVWTPGPASRSSRTRRHRAGSSSESRAHSRSAGTSQVPAATQPSSV